MIPSRLNHLRLTRLGFSRARSVEKEVLMPTTQRHAQKVQTVSPEETTIGKTLAALRDALAAYSPQHDADAELMSKEIWACNRATD